MNSVKGNNLLRQYVVPVLASTAIMVLLIMTLPMTGIPATRVGGYGSGGGGVSAPAAPAATTTAVIGTVSFSAPASIAVGTLGTVSLVISGPDSAGIDPLSMIFAGAPVQSMYVDANGKMVLVFDKSKLNLKPGDTSAMLSGKLKDGSPFSGAVSITVVI